MLEKGRVATRLPAQDLRRARAFYAEKLGLEPAEERPGGLRYQCGSGQFALFESAGRPSGDHTQMALEVDDIESVVAELRSRGVVLEEGDVPAHGRRLAVRDEHVADMEAVGAHHLGRSHRTGRRVRARRLLTTLDDPHPDDADDRGRRRGDGDRDGGALAVAPTGRLQRRK